MDELRFTLEQLKAMLDAKASDSDGVECCLYAEPIRKVIEDAIALHERVEYLEEELKQMIRHKLRRLRLVDGGSRCEV